VRTVRFHLPVLGVTHAGLLDRTDSLGLVVALARPVLRLDRWFRALGRGVFPALRWQTRATLAVPAHRLRAGWTAAAGFFERRAAACCRALLDRRPVRAGSVRALGVLPIIAPATEPGRDGARRRSGDDLRAGGQRLRGSAGVDAV